MGALMRVKPKPHEDMKVGKKADRKDGPKKMKKTPKRSGN
jgi:hypothetical protein